MFRLVVLPIGQRQCSWQSGTAPLRDGGGDRGGGVWRTGEKMKVGSKLSYLIGDASLDFQPATASQESWPPVTCFATEAANGLWVEGELETANKGSFLNFGMFKDGSSLQLFDQLYYCSRQ